jgi:hypothetical protein
MTDKILSTMDDDQRWVVYENCRTKQSPEALATMKKIDALLVGRPNFSVGKTGVKLDEPFGRLMASIVNSELAVQAAAVATIGELPAMAGVEPILSARLGLSYSKRYEANIQAGYLVAMMMDRLGYIRSGQDDGPMPPGSLATTGIVFLAKSN